MALYKSAQSVMEPIIELPEDKKEDQVILYEQKPTEEEVLEIHSPAHEEEHELEIVEPHNEDECVFVMPLIPGAPDAEIELEVSEGDSKEDKKESKKSKEDNLEANDPWDWKAPEHFIEWAQYMVNNVPKHSGKNIPGLERACAHLKRIISESSKAMQQDFHGKIDADKLSDILDKIHEGLDRCEERIETLRSSKSKKKRGAVDNDLVKEAQKTPRVGGVVITVPLLISSIARSVINGTVSAGKDLEDLYKRAVKIHKLDLNQQTELMQLLADMNFPVRRDFIYGPDDDTGHQENGSLITNYQA